MASATHGPGGAAKGFSLGGGSMFVVTVRALSPQYDIWVDQKVAVEDDPTSAIERCKKEFVAAVRGWFRDHEPTEIYGVEFDPKKLETYSSGHMSKLWENGGEGDSPSIYSSPGGPAIAQVMEFVRGASGEWEERAVIYQLPKDAKPYHKGQTLDLFDNEFASGVGGAMGAAAADAGKKEFPDGTCPKCGAADLDYQDTNLYCCSCEEDGFSIDGGPDDPDIRRHLVKMYPDKYAPVEAETLEKLKLCRELGPAQQALLLRMLGGDLNLAPAAAEESTADEAGAAKRARIE
jgi:hypothetical protein